MKSIGFPKHGWLELTLSMNNPLLECLAALEHEQWAAWTRHFLSNQTPENVERWEKQLAATYEQLSESEKEADRTWAKKVLVLIESLQNPPSDVLFEGRFLRVKKKDRWEYVERHKTSGIVAILAITEKQEIILVEQFRVPVNKRVIEIPAGLAGDIEGEEDEALASAAKRELVEETGYEAQRMEYLTEGPPSAGLSTEVVTFFRAQGLKKVSEGGGDGSENIHVHAVLLTDLEPWIETKRKEGCLVDYKVYAALYFQHTRATT
jgi:ADP-ribose pyrophosphatase